MKLRIICEAYDKNLAMIVARSTGLSPQELKAIVQQIDPPLTYGTYILKQIKEYGYVDEMLDALSTALNKFINNLNKITDKNIYNYTLRDLIALTEQFDEEIEEDELGIHPIKMKGVEFLKTFKDNDIQYYVYAIYDPNSLADLAEDTSWCVAGVSMARLYLDQNAQVMIFKNESPTTLFNINGFEIKNSGNTEELRPEILLMVDDIIDNYKAHIEKRHEEQLPVISKMINHFNKLYDNQKINKYDPNNLTDEEKNILLSDIDSTMERYVNNSKYKGEWPELKEAIKHHKRRDMPVAQHFINYGQKSGMNYDEIIDYLGALKEYGPAEYAGALFSYFTHNTKKRIPEYEAIMPQLLQQNKGTNEPQYKRLINQLLMYCSLATVRLPESEEDEALALALDNAKHLYNATVLPANVTFECDIIDATSNKYDIKMRVVTKVADWDVVSQIRGSEWYITKSKIAGTDKDIDAANPYNEPRTKERIADIVGRIELGDKQSGQFIHDPARPRLGN